MIEIAKLVFELLAPIAAKMIDHAMAGNDPRDVLRDEKVADVCPPQSATERAMLAARKGGAQ
jgi:hypothetical protein